MRMAPVAGFLLTLGAASASGPAEDPPRPLDPGYVERTGVSLILLEVEAVDKRGNPLRGLTLEDFVVRLDGRLWTIATFDDLCSCADGVAISRRPITEEAPPTTPVAPPTGAAGESGVASEPEVVAQARRVRYVLYFDFSQLQLGGRRQAIDAAREWVAETMGTEDETTVVAYAPATGLHTICPFTSSKAEILAGLGRASSDPRLVDHFPNLLESRIIECEEQPAFCRPNAMQEYRHGRQSLSALKRFLADLEEQPGRKTVLFFHENGVISPAGLYGIEASDHLRLVEEVGAEATAARSAVYPLKMGGTVLMRSPDRQERLDREALVLGANLSEATGGRYNRGAADLSRLLDRLARACRCTYLLGLTPPAKASRRVYTARVVAAGVTLPALYRVRYLSPADRWMWKAVAVLADPDKARDLDIGAAITPLTATGRRWDVTVQVALDVDALTLIPLEGRREGTWEVGALLSRIDHGENWEMLGTFKVQRALDEAARKVILHQRMIQGLPPGKYRLAAFIRDRIANLFGGAEALLDLPDPSGGGMAGPVQMRAAREQIVSSLPLSKGRRPVPARARGAVGPIPSAKGPVRRGERLEMLTWICPAKGEPPPVELLRFVSRDGVPVFKFKHQDPEPAGVCRRIADLIDTSKLEAGLYAYSVRPQRESGGLPVLPDVPFEVADY